jgi:6-phosphogluconolactonase
VIRIFRDAESLARDAAEDLIRAAAHAILERGQFRLGLSGGTTPGVLYADLGHTLRDHVDWSRVEVLFADERAVPPDHPDSNFGMVEEKLLKPLGIEGPRVHRMRGEADDLAAAALAYERHLVEPIDLLVLGVGEDGHTASLFPGSPALAEIGRRALAIEGPKPPPRRITITPRTIGEARLSMVLATGESKARAVALALEGPADSVPAALARRGDWYLDRLAARDLVHVQIPQ